MRTHPADELPFTSHSAIPHPQAETLLRLLDTAPASGAWNMAVDEVLAETVRTGGPSVLRFYRWAPACLSLGRNQPAYGRYDLEQIRARGLDVVRRPTGGRAVLHDCELTYSVVLPAEQFPSPRTAYAAINRGLVAGLRRLGVPARLQPRTAGRAPTPSIAPCFKDPTQGEVIAAGRKLLGSAQRRDRGVLLQHGSLPLRGDAAAAVRALLLNPASAANGTKEKDPADNAAPVPLVALCDPLPPWNELAAALAEGIRAALGATMEPGDLAPAEQRRAAVLCTAYADPARIWHQ